MLPEEILHSLFEKSDVKKIIPFLKELDPSQKKSLVPHIKKLYRENNQYIQDGNSWRNKMSVSQGEILAYSSFVCCNRSDFEKLNGTWLIGKIHLDNILPWYSPSWFSDYINDFREKDLPYQLDYAYLMELTAGGYLKPHPQLIAQLLVRFIFHHAEKKGFVFAPEKLDIYPETLREHIWYLFEYDTSIHLSNRYIYIDGKKLGEESSWETAFMHVLQEGRIDRIRLLKECLLASSRNFNKQLSGWYANLFEKLQAEPSEILRLQPELYVLFSSPHSKVVNTAVTAVRKIVHEDGFDCSKFLDHAPLLLSSSAKSNVSTTLQVLERIAKVKPELKGIIAITSANALVQKDEAVQKKAARLILNSGKDQKDEISSTLSTYTAGLFSSVKSMLSDFLDQQIVHEAVPDFQVPDPAWMPDPDHAISVSDLDELLFLSSQVFDNNEPWHLELVLDGMIRFRHQINGDTLSAFEPVFQRAWKIFQGDFRNTMGNLDGLMVTFFLDFGQLMMKKFPDATLNIRKLYESFMNKTEALKLQWKTYGNSVSFKDGWTPADNIGIYEPHRHLLRQVYTKLTDGDTTPLLSTPTHKPCWINPVVLVQRLLHYQQFKKPYDYIDFQLALLRCSLSDTREALQLTDSMADGEEKRILRFLLDPSARPEGPFETQSAWMISALSKNPFEIYEELDELIYSRHPRGRYTGQFPWKTFVEKYERSVVEWITGKLTELKVPDTRKVLKLDPSYTVPEVQKTGVIKKWLGKLKDTLTGERLPVTLPLIYEHFHIKSTWLDIVDRDIQRILFLTPNNPEPLLALGIQKCLAAPAFSGETEKKFVIGLLRAIHEIRPRLGETGHLFIATCMVCSDKTAVSIAAEIWIQGISSGRIDPASIGRILGIHQRIDFVPLKRLNDLIMLQLLNLSSQHNRALEQMLTAFFMQLNGEPVKHIKKLISIYTEILELNQSKGDDNVSQKLLSWESVKS